MCVCVSVCCRWRKYCGWEKDIEKERERESERLLNILNLQIILLADVFPTFFIKLFAAYFMNFIPYWYVTIMKLCPNVLAVLLRSHMLHVPTSGMPLGIGRLLYAMEPPNRGHFNSWDLSFIQRLSSRGSFESL